MPVLHANRDIDHISRMQFQRLLAPLLIPSPSRDADQNLPAALIRVMEDLPADPPLGLWLFCSRPPAFRYTSSSRSNSSSFSSRFSSSSVGRYGIYFAA